jgi:Protein of unknown function (DUF3617)
MRATRVLIAIALVASALPLLAQTISLRPGNYETTMEMEMPGGMKVPPMKNTQCITAADLKDMSKKLLEGEGTGCKVSEYKVVENRITFNAVCKEANATMTMAADMTFTTDTYTGIVKAKDDKGMSMTMKSAGKRIGDCK